MSNYLLIAAALLSVVVLTQPFGSWRGSRLRGVEFNPLAVHFFSLLFL